MTPALLLVEHPADGVVLIRLNQPERRNALATPLLRALAAAVDAAAADPAVRCTVITGDRRAFAAGADINELAAATSADIDVRPELWARIRRFPKPLLAAVNGWCLGAGNELLMCCDLAVAASDARFGQPETNLGIMPGAGGVATLARLVGRTRAMRMVLLGEPLSAAEALACGLIAQVVAPEEVLQRALELADTLAARAPLALRLAKACILAAYELPHDTHLVREREAFLSLLDTDDKQEGVQAFLDKRPPVWRGR